MKSFEEKAFHKGVHGGGRGCKNGEGHGRPEHSGRIFGHGEMRLVILQLLGENAAHGYELIKSIEERLDGAYAPSPGLIYPTLTQLEEAGYLSSEAGEDSKRSYSITEAGREYLKFSKNKVDHIFERMAHVASCQRKANSPELSAAMDKLKQALRGKTTQKEFNSAQARSMAEIIEQAAGAIEKL
jgi:DNA-binding PadR family transcriptional regulator